MVSPYRGAETSAPASPGQKEGLVDELIKQFADPLAFYRELVQNGIDAGATSLAVTLSFEPDASDEARGTLLVSVRDDGCGMGREILEEQLTVLFRSGKEGQEGKIGKFGVGFVSVLAVKPKLVAVKSSQGKGEQWTLHLHPDQTYELFRAEGGGASGTTVTLHVPMEAGALGSFVEGSERALLTWCRHIEVPLRLVASVSGQGAPLREVRVDRPFGLEAVVHVEVTADSGRTRVVAGLPEDGQPYLAFFNRGLLLHETRSDVLGAVAVKIQDARLEHTLSRDNVRRDEHYERVMRLARRVVDEDLPAHAAEVLSQLAEKKREEPRVDTLLLALTRAELELSADEVRVALLHPHAGRRSTSLRALLRADGLGASRASELTEALARAGRPVADLGVAIAWETYRRALSALAGAELELAEAAVTLATPIEPRGSDLAMLEVLARVLGKAHRAPAAPRLVRLRGGVTGSTIFVAGEGEPPAILSHEDARRDPFRRLRRPPLWIDAGAPIVAAARRAAEREPELAGALLARAVLLAHGSLDEGRDEGWIAAALEELGA